MKCVPSVVISTDTSLVATLKRCIEGSGVLELAFEFAIAFRSLTELQIEKIQRASPRFLFIDLDDDAETGCRVARYLADANPDARIVALGTGVTPESLVEAMRAGVSEYLEKPLTQQAFDEAIDRLSRKPVTVSGSTRVSTGKTLLFFGAKGGAGATTVATNFAIQLHRQTSQRVLLVDLDLTLGEVALYLGIEPRYGIVDLARNLHRMDEGLLGSYAETHASGVQVLAAPFDPDERRGIGAAEVERMLAFLRSVYDWIVLDASNSLDGPMLAGVKLADEILCVTQVDVPSLRNIQRIRGVLKRVVSQRPLRVILNRFHPTGDITLKDVERALGLEVFWTLSNDYDSITQGINAGEPPVLTAASVCGREVSGLVGKLTGIPADPEPRSRWASRFRSARKRGISMATAVPVGAER